MKNKITFLSTIFFYLFLLHFNHSYSQCTNAPVTEAVRNGDFEAGYITKNGSGHTYAANSDFDFQSDLTSGANFTGSNCISGIGNTYGVARFEPAITCDVYPDQAYLGTDYITVPFEDHTPGMNGDGFAFVADFEGFAGSKYDPSAAGYPAAWRQRVTIQANETYYFSAWFTNYNRNAASGPPTYTYPRLHFVVIPMVGGVLQNGARADIGVATPTGAQMLWEQFYSNPGWYSGAYTEAMLLIEVEASGSSQANDILIDDISFINSCVNINSLPDQYIPDLGASTSICLTNGSLELDSGVPTDGSTQFWWYEVTPTASTLVNGSTAPGSDKRTINHAGTYTVCIKNGAFPGACTASSTVVVTNTMPPVTLSNANICSSATTSLTASLTGTGLSYSWGTRPAGVSNVNSATMTTSVEGNYAVTVTPSVAGCAPVTSNTATVTRYSGTPSVQSMSGTCSGSRTFTLQATGGPAGSQYAWYDAATGGNQLGVGTPVSLTYTAAQLTPSRTVYVENFPASTLKNDKANYAASDDGGDNQRSWVSFTANQSFTLVSVEVKPAYCGGGNFRISLWQNGSVIAGTNVVRPCVAGSWVTVPLNYTIPAGSGYQLRIFADGGGRDDFSINTGSSSNTTTTLATIAANSWGWGAFTNWIVKTGANCVRTPITLDCVLPVNFIWVNARQVESSVYVNWAAQEDNNRSDYIMERSLDGAEFRAIGSIPAINAPSYTFVDHSPSSGINYYRIKKGEEEGTIQHSNIVQVNYNQEALLTVHPNPFNGQTIISVTPATSENSDVVRGVLKEISGKHLQTLTFERGASVEFGADLSPGTYLLHLESGEVYKIIKF